MTATNGSNIAAQYQATNLPLFGANGPSYLDVNQGNVGDCYFDAALAETAKQDPSAITSMIQENSNGTYSVDFQVDGKSDYVTVNNELPVMEGGYEAADGSTLEFDNSATGWSPLIEKAYAQLMEQTDVTPGADLGVNGDSYADISGGGGQGITLITGQSYNIYAVNAGELSSNLNSLASTLQSAFASGQDIMLGTSDQTATGNLVAAHMFEVIGVDASAGTVTLQNPWNGSGIGQPQAMQFTISLAALASDNPAFYVSTGKPTVAAAA